MQEVHLCLNFVARIVLTDIKAHIFFFNKHSVYKYNYVQKYLFSKHLVNIHTGSR